MEGYVVFDGGGVKGAALAGCLAAAEAQGITFVGYGGTSAGSIVAMLGAAGFSGEELEELLVKRLSFVDLLDDNGKLLAELRSCVDKVGAAFGSDSTLFRKFSAAPPALALHRRLWVPLGLYPGKKLRRFLWAQVKRKLPSLPDDPTFAQFEQAGAKPLKVLATDLTRMRAARFPDDCATYCDSVLSAVHASSAYPFVFKPVEVGGARLTDGGLSSNLPAFLFETEHRKTRLPVLAFDLVSVGRRASKSYHCGHLGKDLLDVALEAGDVLLRGMATGVEHFPIEIPADIDAMQFDLDRSARQNLFDTGFKQATRQLARWDQLTINREAGERLQAQLQGRYGNPKVVVPVLEAIRTEVIALMQFESVRVHVALPTNRGTRMVVYSVGMEGQADADLELAMGAGCSGEAWTSRKPAFADLMVARNDPAAWEMTPLQTARIPEDRAFMMCVPIIGEFESPIGTLSVDTASIMPLDKLVDDKQLKAAVSRLIIWSSVLASIFAV